MTTLLALYSRPEGGPDALEAFERSYAETHLPLIARVPGLRGLRVQRVARSLAGEADLVLVAALEFADRPSFDAALASEEMRAAARNLRQIAPGLATLLVTEDAPELLPEGWR